MANASAMAGLASGLGLLGQSIMDKEKEDRQDARDERKAKLAAQVAIQVNQAKQAFMRANPRFTQHVTTASGDLYGISQTGDIKLLHGATDEEKAIGQEKRDNEGAYKQAQVANIQANMGLLGPRASLMEAQTTNQLAAAARAARGPAPKAPPKDPHIVPPAYMDKLVDAELARTLSEIDMKTMDPAEKMAARVAAQKKLASQGYSVGFQGVGAAASANPFAQFIPPSADEADQSGDIPDPQEEDDGQDPLGY